MTMTALPDTIATYSSSPWKMDTQRARTSTPAIRCSFHHVSTATPSALFRKSNRQTTSCQTDPPSHIDMHCSSPSKAQLVLLLIRPCDRRARLCHSKMSLSQALPLFAVRPCAEQEGGPDADMARPAGLVNLDGWQHRDHGVYIQTLGHPRLLANIQNLC
ncbi:hypothetical protein J3458_005642 [Metarhizium acridum]|uniref:uncharacterized protein n=1 Tax=Metarhizium acridum TaxID=92637 RepID=UPI001C6CCD90|nr:hypothetical protein J3458_005642 [Metarhizium acridum]